jgi:hypothetical protein
MVCKIRVQREHLAFQRLNHLTFVLLLFLNKVNTQHMLHKTRLRITIKSIEMQNKLHCNLEHSQNRNYASFNYKNPAQPMLSRDTLCPLDHESCTYVRFEHSPDCTCYDFSHQGYSISFFTQKCHFYPRVHAVYRRV